MGFIYHNSYVILTVLSDCWTEHVSYTNTCVHLGCLVESVAHRFRFLSCKLWLFDFVLFVVGFVLFCVLLVRFFMSSSCVLSASCCPCLCIVHSWLPLRFFWRLFDISNGILRKKTKIKKNKKTKQMLTQKANYLDIQSSLKYHLTRYFPQRKKPEVRYIFRMDMYFLYLD